MVKIEFEKYEGSITGGKGRLIDKLLYRLHHLRNGKYTLEVKAKVRRRTCPQNALYWMWLNIIAEHTGNSAMDLHEYFKRLYLPPCHKEVMGKIVEVDITTTTLSTAEFAAYMLNIETFAASELGITLPHPDDNEFAAYYDDYLQKYNAL